MSADRGHNAARRDLLRAGAALTIAGGTTIFRRNAMPRKIMIVTDTMEQASSGHMKRPPLEKNPRTPSTIPAVSAMIQATIIR